MLSPNLFSDIFLDLSGTNQHTTLMVVNIAWKMIFHTLSGSPYGVTADAVAAADSAATDPATVWMCPPLGTANVVAALAAAAVVALRQLYMSIDSMDMHSTHSAQQSTGREGKRLDNLENRGTK